MKTRKPIIAVLLFTAFLLPVAAREPAPLANARILPIAKSSSPVTVTPDRADWTYSMGEQAEFRITVDVSPYPVDGFPVRYKLGPEMLEGTEQTALVPKEGLLLPVQRPAQPGFVRCTVTAVVDGKDITQSATIGYAPWDIKPTQTEPADFDQFWAEQKAALAKIPPDYRLEPAPELSSEKAEAFYLSFRNVGGRPGPSRFYGVLCVPRGQGPFPAVLVVPGAGVRPYTGSLALAEKGVITLQVGIHGIPVNLPAEVYDTLKTGALDNYARFNLDDRSAYYYRRVYLGCLRAADYLTTRQDWDGKNLIVMGGSQGGQLSIVTAALEPRMTAVAALYPAYSDVSGYLHGRAGGWPGLFRPSENGAKDAPVEPKLLTTSYYDTVNFAKRLRAPGIYFQGYNDVTCPPTSVFAVYNIIAAPKQLVIGLEHGHAWSRTQQEPIDAWVHEQLSIR